MKIKIKIKFFHIFTVLILTSTLFCSSTDNSIKTSSLKSEASDTNTNNNKIIKSEPIKNFGDIYGENYPNKIEDIENFNITIYKSKDPPNNTNFVRFIYMKEKLFLTDFKKFNNRFSPENESYNNLIYSLGWYWFLIAGITGSIFILYMILNKFLGKFRGAKRENLEENFKYYAWGVFSKNFF